MKAIKYSTKFLKAFTSLIELEGGYANDRLDVGRETKFGICQRAYPKLNISDITLHDAQKIYYNDYWLAHEYDKIKNAAIASKVFHTTVNTGPRQSHTILQRALRAVGNKNIVEDGVFGIKTLNAVNDAPAKVLMAALRSEQAAFYRLLISSKPSQVKFRNGWLKRAYN